MIDAPTLRKLGSATDLESKEVLAEACIQAAETIEELCKHIDDAVRIAADAIAQRQSP